MLPKARTILIAGQGWRVAWDILQTQPKLVLSAFMFYVVLYSPYYIVWLNIGPSMAIRHFLDGYGSQVIALAQVVLCLPLTYAACRRVLLPYYPDHLMWHSAAWRNRALLAVATGLFLLKLVIAEITGAISAGLLHSIIQSDSLALVAQWLLWFAGLYFGLKLWLLVPAAAMNANGLSIRNAILDTNSQFWRLWFTWLLASSPLWIPNYALAFVSDHNVHIAAIAGNISGLWTELVGFVLIIVGAAVMSIYYEAIGRKLKGV